jgi:hypothetical protein
MGSIRAPHEAGLRVPEDVSILGFDDIQSNQFQVPQPDDHPATTARDDSTVARMLWKKLHDEATPDLIHVDPELIVRESTDAVASSRQSGKQRKIRFEVSGSLTIAGFYLTKSMRRRNRRRPCRIGQSKDAILFELVEAIHGQILKHLRFAVRPERLNFIRSYRVYGSSGTDWPLAHRVSHLRSAVDGRVYT